MLTLVFLLIAIGVMSLGLTAVIRRFALRYQLMDIPNARSSHELPTPRGGGLAIVSVFLLVLWGFYREQQLSSSLFLSLFIGGTVIALTGLWDDYASLSARRRFLLQAIATISSLLLLKDISQINLGFAVWHWGWLAWVLASLGIIWLLNLYNFMDGIDGIAGSEAIFVSSASALLLWFSHQYHLALLLAVFAICIAGFLVLNWPPAKIFMGDVGSSFIGFVFGILIITTTSHSQLSIWPWLILLSTFWVDATWTLIRRMLRGEQWYHAHRSHAYQQLSRRWQSHKKVTIAMSLFNLFWLLPWAIVAWRWPALGLVACVVAIAPLFFITWIVKAGTS